MHAQSFVPAFFDLLRTPANAPDAALRSLRAALATWRTLDILLERFSVQYAVGTQVSMVDVFFAPFLVLYRVNEYYRDFRVPDSEDFAHVRRWRAAVLSHPALQCTRPSAALLVKLYYAVSAQHQPQQLQQQQQQLQQGGDPTADAADESDAAAAALVAAALRDGQVEAIAASSAAEAVAGTGTVVSQLPRALPAVSSSPQHAGAAAQSVADRRAEAMFSPGRSRSPSGGAMSPLGGMPSGVGAVIIGGALSPVHSRPGTATAARGMGALVARSATPQPASRALSPPPSATRNASATPAPDHARTPSQAPRPRAVQSPQPPERVAQQHKSAAHADGGGKSRGASRRPGAAVRAREQQ